MVATKVTSRHYRLKRILNKWDTALEDLQDAYQQGATLIDLRDMIWEKTGIKVDPTTIHKWMRKGMLDA